MKQRKLSKIALGLIGACIMVAAVVYIYLTQINSGAKLTFSQESGFYDKELTLELKANKKNATIYYTTDGSTPTLNSETYKDPILIQDRSSEENVLSTETGISFLGDYIPKDPIPKATVVRAFAKYSDGKQSKIITKTYFVGSEFGDKYKDIPVISLAINPDDFYDNEKGIYIRGKVYDDWVKNGGDEVNTPTWEMPANFTQKGREWERNIHFELFENEKPTTFTQDLGVRILGGASRGVMQKSLKFYARKEYGKGSVNYELFPDNVKKVDQKTPLHTYDTFALRNGGNDSWLTKFRHRYIQLLVNDRAFTTQETRPVIVFLNGEYWGIYTMQDDYSDNYVYRNFDIAKDNVVMYKMGEIEEGTDADLKLYDDVISFATDNDLNIAENYEKICDMVDMQSLIDYFCTEIYIANGDWLNHNNNYRLWRSRTKTDKPYEDGKWRYMLYDSEFSMGIYTQGQDYNLNTIEQAITVPEDGFVSQVGLFQALLKSDTFKQQFTNTLMDLVNKNFNKDHMNSLLTEIIKEYEPYMEDYYKRFGCTYPEAGEGSVDAFYTSIDELKVFINHRNDYVPKMLKESLNLTGNTVDVTVGTNDAAGGEVTINTIKLELSNGDFTGQYFSDYPITLTATPKDGYTFTGWTGDTESTDATITVSLYKACSLQAQFKKN